MPRGIVAFVGNGPGDPALRTERACRRVAEADRVFDPTDDVGAEELVGLARQGKRVVCLVAGDPLESSVVVARAVAVAAAGAAIEVVPGIGARAAASAFAGVLGRAVRLKARDVGGALACEPADEWVTVVIGAGSPSQRVVTARAAGAANGIGELDDVDVILAFGSPEDGLRWAERRPLFGKRILVTRALEQATRTASILRDHGADPVVVPSIEIHPAPDSTALARAIDSLRAGAYRWVAFTSANGVDRTWDALRAAGADARAFGASRLAAIGPATASALEDRGLRADVIASEFRGEALAAGILSAMGSDLKTHPAVLLPRAARARDVLPDALRGAGCRVDVVAAYETRSPSHAAVAALKQELEDGRIDAVTFTSSSTVDHLCDLLGPEAQGLLSRPCVASIGPVTSATAEKRGLRVDITARDFTVPGLVDALLERYSAGRSSQ